LQPGCDKRRVYDEVQALQRVRSKHVVQIYDVVIAQPGNQIGIVQEYLPGDDLHSFHASTPTPIGYLRVLYQIAKGLEDIHQEGLIHRDIKPKNVKRDQEELLRIIDFGLSRPNSDAETIGFVGTKGFAAPELYRGGQVAFTSAVDVYAFGATALFLVRGNLPSEFLEEPPRAEAWVRVRGFATSPLAVPAQLVPLLNRTLATDPSERPSMATLRVMIERHLVQGRHRALLVHNSRTHVCDVSKPSVTLSKPNVGSVVVTYDGFRFAVTTATGDVYVNNAKVSVGSEIPASCVITLGSPSLESARSFITMDISQPEVVL
jgi:serine/threonine-protein kinase